MVITPHALLGAALGRGRSPAWGLALGISSHYLLDQLPHRDYSIYDWRGKVKIGVELAVVESVLAQEEAWDVGTLAGASGGILPDVVSILWPRSAPSRLHRYLHKRLPQPFEASKWGNRALQGAVVLLAVGELRRRGRRQKR